MQRSIQERRTARTQQARIYIIHYVYWRVQVVLRGNFFGRVCGDYIRVVKVQQVCRIQVVLSRQAAAAIGRFPAAFLPLFGTVEQRFQPYYFC